jgi:hypothetical protein
MARPGGRGCQAAAGCRGRVISLGSLPGPVPAAYPAEEILRQSPSANRSFLSAKLRDFTVTESTWVSSRLMELVVHGSLPLQW